MTTNHDLIRMARDRSTVATRTRLVALADALEAAVARADQLERVAVVARLVARYDYPPDINGLRAALAALDAQETKT